MIKGNTAHKIDSGRLNSMEDLQALNSQESPEGLEELLSQATFMDEVLDLESITLDEYRTKKYSNGLVVDCTNGGELRPDEDKKYWIYSHNQELIGMGHVTETGIKSVFNLPQV